MNADGSQARPIVQGPRIGSFSRLPTHPAWSPDGTKIAFASHWEDDTQSAGNWNIYVADIALDNSNISDPNDPRITKLTVAVDAELHPAWSPDGSKIAFQTKPGGPGNGSIYVMNSDGGYVTNLNASATPYFSMVEWSPDGSQILFVSNRDGDEEIYVTNLDGSSQTNLTNSPGNSDFHPSWSPDGSQITFTRGSGCIWIMNSDGSSQTQLRTADAEAVCGRWSTWKP